MLDERQKTLIQDSYREVSIQLIATGQRFYHHLFRLYPQVRPLFPDDISGQSMKLMQTIGFAVSHLNAPDILRPVVAALGARHTGYGVQPEHYALVGEALLTTLEEILGSSFTPEVKEAWGALYGELVDAATSTAA